MSSLFSTSLHVTVLWRHADWGLYGRRHEALARELARRSCVKSVLHVEPVSAPEALRIVRGWWRASGALKAAYATQLRKLLARTPVPVGDRTYVTSILTVLNRSFPAPLGIVNARLIRWQMAAIRRFRDTLPGKTTCTLVYPPGLYLSHAMRMLDSDIVVADLVDDVLARVDNTRLASMYRTGYRNVLDRADHAFATSEAVQTRFSSSPCQIEVLPNGVVVPDADATTPPAVTRNEDTPVVAYAGQLNQALDPSFVKPVVRACDDLTFRFYGPATDSAGRRLATDPSFVKPVVRACDDLTFRFYGPATDSAGRRLAGWLGKRSNVELVGSVPYTNLYDALRQADVLVNFKVPNHTTAGNDLLKIYEYLTTGRPIVSPPVSPVDRFEDVIYVADTARSLVSQLRVALQEAEKDDADERFERRIRYARQNAWSKRVDTILAMLKQLSSTPRARVAKNPPFAE